MIDLLVQHAGMIGLLFFFSVFIFIVFWSFNPKKRTTIESYKYIPLTEDHNERK